MRRNKLLKTTTKTQDYPNIFIYLLAFTSGFCIMGIELLGGRILAPYFGSSVHIWGSIITVFMLSLSLGYLLGGKLSTRSASLATYGLIFLISAITLLPIALFSQGLMEIVFLNIEDSRYGSLLASMVLFFIPTVILGMLSPYSVRLLVKSSNESGQVAGKLYFISTLGSALGTIVTSFYLILWFDINIIVFSFSGVLACLGLLAIFINRSHQLHKVELSHV
mgnify:CR=1 FL=1